MFELVDVIIAFVLGFIAAIAFMSWLVQRWAKRIRRLLEEALAEEAKEPSIKEQIDSGRVIPLTIEVENNQFLCYNSNTNQFICQGSDVQEIIDRFKQRFPGLNAVLHAGDEQALKTLRQQLKEHRTQENIETAS